jgi:tRNA A-37 threonylcarbamoyl transferase component Bud32
MEAIAPSKSRFPELAKYEVVEEIGHGGMATVYRARDRRLGREVAVKIIHPHLRDSREVVSRFNTEARAVAKLRHPNIVEVFDVSEEGEPEQYLVAELLRGTTLRKLLQQHGAMPPEVAGAFALDLLAAIAHANDSGVVHRDIKPENVLIEYRPTRGAAVETPAPGGDRVIVKLTDFGIAKLLDAQGVTSTGQVLGSPAHMAPEQIEGGDVDARADVFGMGVLLYECMVGHLPFEGNNPAQVLRRVLDGTYPSAQTERPIVGARWSALLDKALAHAPADRFADANAMREAVQAELGRLGITAPAGELAAWLDDTEAYAAAHASRMIDKLVSLGAEARKARNPIGAAGDYNRALAHAPDDPQLLRIVAGMNRTEARTRLLKRAGVALLLMVGLGGVAFGIGRALHASVAAPITVDTAVALPVSSVPAVPSAVPSASASATARPVTVPVLRLTMPSARPIERALHLDLTPSMGVKVSIDGAPPRDVATGDAIAIDGKVHSLAFSCSVCVPASRDVAAGDRDDTVVVRLAIKPATLDITGDGNKTYQIVEHPEVAVRVGANGVAMGSEFERVTVRQIESAATVTVRLHAGHVVEATF